VHSPFPGGSVIPFCMQVEFYFIFSLNLFSFYVKCDKGFNQTETKLVSIKTPDS
jgi:hypothetical protein